MRDVVNRINLDLDKKLWNKSVSVKKNDTLTRTLCITLVNDGEVHSLENILTAAIRCIKPDGKVVYNDCVIEGNEIRYLITNQTICVKGTVVCEIVLSDIDGKVMTSPQFEIEVYDTLFDNGELESANEYGGITQVVAQCEQAKNQCTTSEKNVINISEKVAENLEMSTQTAEHIEEMLDQTEQNVSKSALYAASALESAEKSGICESNAKKSEENAADSKNAAAISAEDASNSALRAIESEQSTTENARKVETAGKKVQEATELSRSYAESAESDARLVKSYLDGSSGIREGEETDNTKYYKNETQRMYEDFFTKVVEGDFHGIQGLQGEKGDTGEQGPAGQDGAKGEQGVQGPQGLQGLQGEKGDVGPTGETGATGAPGERGLKGEKGDKGDKGDTGESGVTTPLSSFFTLSVDDAGNLYAYSETSMADAFDFDEDTGNLFFVTEG